MKKRCIFLVQGEGRGHMTQAIALSRILRDNGYEITRVFIGVSDRREVPAYFREGMDCEVRPLRSPNFVLDEANKSLKIWASIVSNLGRAGTYLRSIRALHEAVQETRAELLINFYDILGGMYFLLYRPHIRHVAVGHQFLADHPDFPFAEGRPLEKWLFKLNNRMMSLYARRKLALSFAPYNPKQSDKLVVVPPLLREDVLQLSPTDDHFILAYMVNDGYGEEIMQWHARHRDVVLHCFWDRKGVPEEWRLHKNLTFHQISGAKFIEMMARCSGYVTTAGFESICEAMLLGKPILMIPVQSQYEQACNALDAERAGAGISADAFEIGKLLDFMSRYTPVASKFAQWASQAESRIVEALEPLQ